MARVAMVMVAFAGVLLTYYGQSVGLAIVNLRPSILDILLPMALTVVEFYVVFRPGEPPDGSLPVDWYCGLAVWALLAASVVASVATRIDRHDYSSELWPIARDYRTELWRDVAAATALGLGTVAVVLLWHDELRHASELGYPYLAVAGAFLVAGLRSQGRARRSLGARLGLPI